MVSRIRKIFSYFSDYIFEESEDEFLLNIQSNAPPLETAIASDAPETRKTGTITAIKEDIVLIDNEYGYKLPKIDANLQVDSLVWFTLRILENGNRVVTNLGLLEERNTEEESPDFGNNTATVTSLNGRTVCLSNLMTCNLDHASVKSGYSIAEGDVVAFEVNKVRGQDVVKTLEPSFERQMKGVIQELDGSCGVIKCGVESVWFTTDVLPNSYKPLEGDIVKLTAILTDCKDKPDKRAIEVRFIDHQKIVEDEHEISDVSVTVNTDFKVVNLEDSTQSLTLRIKNNGSKKVTLIRGNFRRSQDQLFVSGLSYPQTLYPSTECSITFHLNPKFIGFNSETYDFYFNGFRVSRTFHMHIRTPFLQKINVRGGKYKFTEFKETIRPERALSSYGSTPYVKKHFRKQGQRYIIPPKMKEILTEANRTEFKALIDAVYPVLPQPVSFNTYKENFHLLLFLEEMFINFAVAKLSRDHVFFKKSGEFLLLNMPGLLEQRPSPIVGDKVIVTQPWLDDKSSHVGFIHNITKDTISVDFNVTFKNDYNETACCVEFQCQLGSIHLMHRAIDQAWSCLPNEMLFPVNLTPQSTLINIQKEDLGLFNKSLNDCQINAVVNILHGKGRPLPYVIFGPPGTGKTATVTELILQLLRYGSGKILVTAPSNSAADLLTKRLIQHKNLTPDDIVRIVAFSRSLETIDNDIERFCSKMDEDTNKTSKSLGYHKITVGTCASIGTLPDNVEFSYVIIDEAGCATEPQTLIPLSYLAPKGVAILAGDPQQLRPTVMSATFVHDYGLTESFLSRIMENDLYKYDAAEFPETDGYDPNLVTCLKLNYRSVPDILAVPNRLFYHSTLIPTITGETGRELEVIKAFHKLHPIRNHPASVVFHGIIGTNYQESDSPSWLNPEEICQTYVYVKELLSAGILPEEIGIISPYRKQVMKLREIILDMLKIDTIKIGSVEEFQGQERMVIILSTVRSTLSHLENDSKQRIGFLCDHRRFNVAVTRARALLIVIGNPHLLSADENWRELLKFCLEAKTYIGCHLPKSLLRFYRQETQSQTIAIQKDESKTDDGGSDKPHQETKPHENEIPEVKGDTHDYNDDVNTDDDDDISVESCGFVDSD